MWNGAGSVSPAGKACDWVGPCHCDSCVAKRGYIVPRENLTDASECEVPLGAIDWNLYRSPYAMPKRTNELTQERAKEISDLVEAQSRLAYYNGVLNEYRLMAERYAALARLKVLRHSILWGEK
ncbi:MAG TPA: hypothetical protein PKV98_04165 [Burkholderiaceae bacterium]|nr:hypothetical protein [Burkholderiaceae bacterium]